MWGVKDLAETDARTYVDATKGGADQHIHLTMQPTGPSHSGAMRILGRLKIPVAAQIEAASARRRVLTPIPAHGLVSIMGPIGLYYANTVGNVGEVSGGQNWDRLASAAHRRELNCVDDAELCLLLFSGDALVLGESEISEGPF